MEEREVPDDCGHSCPRGEGDAYRRRYVPVDAGQAPQRVDPADPISAGQHSTEVHIPDD
ncbi:hypothetical protein [Nesterenkonia pannonica]|uniref:hypothetical protein n=1 Tax=Nesterenkonia pannonica TaxID=1548602 RepID=UPI0021641763|nr:hypothetical protein [Nesterenkonia pannonica]